MSSDIFDITQPNIADRYQTNTGANTQKVKNDWELPDTKPEDESKKSNTDLSFEDMLMLMVTQLQNQTIDNQADTNDMMNQLIQMTVMQALTEMSTQVEDLTNANVMSYSASLVGKEVTIGILDEKTGALSDEVVGTVTATGTYNGQQVIFIGDKYYPLSNIMAVGTLPKEAVDGTGTTPNKPSEGGTQPTDPSNPSKPENPDDTQGAGGAQQTQPDEEEEAQLPDEDVAAASYLEPQLPPEDTYGEGGTDAAQRVNGAQAI